MIKFIRNDYTSPRMVHQVRNDINKGKKIEKTQKIESIDSKKHDLVRFDTLNRLVRFVMPASICSVRHVNRHSFEPTIQIYPLVPSLSGYCSIIIKMREGCLVFFLSN